MNLTQALEYTKEKVIKGYKSDGCTAAPDLGIHKFCEMHDCLRSFKPVSAFQADNLFFKGICTKGKRYWPVAIIYWIAVRLQHTIGYLGMSVLGLAIVVSFLAWIQ